MVKRKARTAPFRIMETHFMIPRFIFATLLVSLLMVPQRVHAAAVTFKIDPQGNCLRDGKPYFIKGAGGDTRLAEMAAAGANSLRTWSPDKLDFLLPEAGKWGLTVSVGIWLESECSWFSYGNPQHCERQFQRVSEIVKKFKDHPALLSWGLGNEMEGDGKNVALWKQVDRLAEMVHREDPAHPTFTALAGMNADKSLGINQHAPHLDFAGINTYGGLYGLRDDLVKFKWTRPYVVTEFGPHGFWERPKTSWNAAYEQTSQEKAHAIRDSYRKSIAPGGQCLGSYIFLWGQKQEASSTWFGTFTADGESTPTVDIMQEIWTGKPPKNTAPVLKSLTSDASGKVLAPSTPLKATVDASDPDADPLTYRWQIMNDVTTRNNMGQESPAAILPIGPKPGNTPSVQFNAPAKPGNYRVFVFVLDGKGHAGTANFPIQIK